MSENQGNTPSGDKQPKKSMNFYWVYAIIGVVLIAMMMFQRGTAGQRLTYREFTDLAKEGYVEKVIIHDQQMGEVTLNEAGFEAKKEGLEGKYFKTYFKRCH